VLPSRQITSADFGGPSHRVLAAPIWHFVVGWIIVVPLLFFSANGTLIPNNEDPAFGATGTDPSSHSSASHLITVAIILLLCSVLIGSRLPSLLSVSRQVRVLLALPFLAICSSLWSVQSGQSLISGTTLLIFTVFALYVGDKFNFQEQLELIILVGAIALPLSIALALFVPAIGGSAIGWRGIFGHKQNCAAVSMILLVTALHWRCSGLYQKVFRVMYIVMCVVLIIMSRSRTGWALTLIALLLSVCIWVMQKLPAKEALLIALLSVVIVGISIYVMHTYAAAIVSAVGKDPTLSQRTIIWSAVWNEIAKRPILGYGYNAFWKGLYGPSQGIVLSSGWNVFQAQNGFLDVWLSVGLLGVALVVIMIGQSMKNAILSFGAGNDAYVRWCTVVILCTVLYNIGESTIEVVQMVWFLFLLACIGLSQTASRARSLRNSHHWPDGIGQAV
jgi:exopolysaccharide production protein ExoQ